jgi:hypothetical protein
MLQYQVVQRDFVLKKNKIRGENDGIFGWSFSIWMPVGIKHVLSADRLFLYARSSRSWRFFSFKIDTEFPLCFGVNDGVEHAGMQCSYCVSISGLQKGQDICHIGREILTFSIAAPHFTPK